MSMYLFKINRYFGVDVNYFYYGLIIIDENILLKNKDNFVYIFCVM